jgi:hypothetical protein
LVYFLLAGRFCAGRIPWPTDATSDSAIEVDAIGRHPPRPPTVDGTSDCERMKAARQASAATPTTPTPPSRLGRAPLRAPPARSADPPPFARSRPACRSTQRSRRRAADATKQPVPLEGMQPQWPPRSVLICPNLRIGSGGLARDADSPCAAAIGPGREHSAVHGSDVHHSLFVPSAERRRDLRHVAIAYIAKWPMPARSVDLDWQTRDW